MPLTNSNLVLAINDENLCIFGTNNDYIVDGESLDFHKKNPIEHGYAHKHSLFKRNKNGKNLTLDTF